MNAKRHDVVVIGGGAAGLSAALVLARAQRDVAVLDAGRLRNAPAGHMQGFLGSDLRLRELAPGGRRDLGGPERAGPLHAVEDALCRRTRPCNPARRAGNLSGQARNPLADRVPIDP